MNSSTFWERIRLLLSPKLLSITCAMLNLAFISLSFHSALPASERWG